MNSPRVVLADADVSIREMLAAVLSAEPSCCCVVGQASTGRGAAALCVQLRPDVVVTSLGLPDWPGPEIVRRLRAEMSGFPGCRLLVYSSVQDRAKLVAVLQAGPAGFVHRGEALETLLLALKAVARGASYFSPLAAELLLDRSQLSHPAEAAPAAGQIELSVREREVLHLVTCGLSNKEIAAKLHLGVRTVEKHRENLQAKLRLRGAAELTRYALYNRLGVEGDADHSIGA